jgi:glycosyltransferase involved in cell wall biosynthesis
MKVAPAMDGVAETAADPEEQRSGRPLKIAMIAPPWFAVPPIGYGGIEWVVSHLTEGLVARGHEVTLFASGGSSTSAELMSTHDPAPSEQVGEWVVEAAALMDAYHRADEFDLVHDHSLLGLLMASMNTVPTVHTVHGPMAPEVFPRYDRLAGRVEMIAISHHHQSTFPLGLYSTVIHNAVDAGQYALGSGRGDYLLFVGGIWRICREKGILDAIE